jgi:hypothetical protein
MPRPPHPVPYVRDDRETPLCVGRDGERYVGDLGQKGTEEFLQRGLDTPPIGEPSDLPVGLRVTPTAAGAGTGSEVETNRPNCFLWELLDLAEAVDYEGNLLPRSDRLVGHDLSGCHFADLRISSCLDLGKNLPPGQAMSGQDDGRYRERANRNSGYYSQQHGLSTFASE